MQPTFKGALHKETHAKTLKTFHPQNMTMKLPTSEANKILEKLDFQRKLDGVNLIVAVARDWITGEPLMQAFMNQEAVIQTLTTGQTTYWSTSREELWTKGKTSGNTQRLRGFRIDCDGDAILLDVEPAGPACHTGLRSCFDTYKRVDIREMKEELAGAIRNEALSLGEFPLTSGKKSSYYLDVKTITSNPKYLRLISRLISIYFGDQVDCVAGPELGAIPIVVSVALENGIPYAMIRKRDRTHGTRREIEGSIPSEAHTLVIDDVATSGGSLIKAIQAVEEMGGNASQVTCVVDRLEGAQDNIRKEFGISLEPLLTIKDLGIGP